MNRADFIHLVRLSEHESADNTAAYRRNVAIFAALGYIWVIGCALLGGGLLWRVGSAMLRGDIHAYWIWLVVFGAGLLWSSLRALWLRLEAPIGQPILPNDAPLLFAALEKIRKEIKGPVIHHVVLNNDFNASISQIPRYGLFGGAVNYLSIGLPLVCALDRPRFLAVLAHEYGHLRGDHGVGSAWIYRTRVTWLKLSNALQSSGSIASVITEGFLHWYFPRFITKTFALARQDEYEADRTAARLVGAQVMAAALVEIQVKTAWLAQEFWASHWQRANSQPSPVGPFTPMANLLAQAPEPSFAQKALREAMRRLSDVDDTHPVLRDCLEALDQSAALPAWSIKSAISLLGPKASDWLTEIDNQWCRDNASEWKQHHAYLRRMHERAQVLLASIGRNNGSEMVELAELQRRLDPQADVLPHYQRALSITPDLSAALKGLVNLLPSTAYVQRMDCLQKLFDYSMANRWWACNMAVQILEPRLHEHADATAQLKLWRERLKHAGEAEERAWEEHSSAPAFHSISRHDLNDYEKGEFHADLARIPAVRRAWLVCKNLREFPHRRCYTVFVELPGMNNDSRLELCRHLERNLSLPSTVLVLWAGTSPTLQEIETHAFHVAYSRTAR